MSLYLGNLSRGVRLDELKRVFRNFGWCSVRMKGSYCFVEYDFLPNAERAMRALRDTYICGEQLSLSWSNWQSERLGGARRGSSRENADEDVTMRESNRDFGRNARNRSCGANVEQGCYNCGAVGHVMRDCPRVNSSARKSYRYESRRGEENERKNTEREEKERSRSRPKKRPRYNQDSCPVSREMSRREKSLVPYRSDSDSNTLRSNSKSRSSNRRLVQDERTADMYSNNAVDPAMKGGLTEQGRMVEVGGVLSEDAKPENWQEATNEELTTLPSILVQLGLADEESRESSGREDDTFVGARNILEQRSIGTKNFENCDGLTTERLSHSLINTKDDDISYIRMVLKHYGISTSGQSRIDLSPEDDEFGSARLWPWGAIFCRRLRKGRLISLQNYARRVKQNREFGIFDKYVRSSSGWGEPGQGNLFLKRKRSRKSVKSV